jgi:hypothetical protein
MSSGKAPDSEFPTGATIADLNRVSAYAFVSCPCGQEKPIFFNVVMRRLGAEATVETLRMKLRCAACRRVGADLRMPGNAPPVKRPPPDKSNVVMLTTKERHGRDSIEAHREWERLQAVPRKQKDMSRVVLGELLRGLGGDEKDGQPGDQPAVPTTKC